MKNPCQSCERSLLDKDECSIKCERRHGYCRHLGISVTGGAGPALRGVVGSMPTRTTKVPVPKPPRPPKPPCDWHASRGMYSKGGRLEKATALMKEGKGNREICRLTGMSKNTAAKLRKVIEAENGGPFLCSCGKQATHNGWCSHRFAKSPKRQAFVASLNLSFGKGTASKKRL